MEILDKLGKFFIAAQPWLIGIVILYLLCIGVAYMFSENFRKQAMTWFIFGIIGMAFAFGAESIGQSLAGIFVEATYVLRAIL